MPESGVIRFNIINKADKFRKYQLIININNLQQYEQFQEALAVLEDLAINESSSVCAEEFMKQLREADKLLENI